MMKRWTLEIDGDTVRVGGKVFHCQLCGHDELWHRKSLLNTRMATFLNLDWLDDTAQVIACRRCGYLHFFTSPTGWWSDELTCPSCGTAIGTGQEECPACGWTYKSGVGPI